MNPGFAGAPSDHNRLLAPFSFCACRHKHTIHKCFFFFYDPQNPLFSFIPCSQHSFPAVFLCAGERVVQGHQQDLPAADLPPDAPLQVDQTERAQEEVTGLVSLFGPCCWWQQMMEPLKPHSLRYQGSSGWIYHTWCKWPSSLSKKKKIKRKVAVFSYHNEVVDWGSILRRLRLKISHVVLATSVYLGHKGINYCSAPSDLSYEQGCCNYGNSHTNKLMDGWFSVRILSSHQCLITSHLNRPKLRGCCWHGSKQI